MSVSRNWLVGLGAVGALVAGAGIGILTAPNADDIFPVNNMKCEQAKPPLKVSDNVTVGYINCTFTTSRDLSNVELVFTNEKEATVTTAQGTGPAVIDVPVSIEGYQLDNEYETSPLPQSVYSGIVPLGSLKKGSHKVSFSFPINPGTPHIVLHQGARAIPGASAEAIQ